MVAATEVSAREIPHTTAGEERRRLEEIDDRWRREHVVDAPGGYQYARVIRPQGFELPSQRQTHSDLAARAMCCGRAI